MLTSSVPRRLVWISSLLCSTILLVVWVSRNSNSSLHKTVTSLSSFSTTPSTPTVTFPGSTYPLIPRKIWQTASRYDPEAALAFNNSWHHFNPTWRYELLSDEAAESYVNGTFALSHPRIVDIYNRVETPVLRYDLLRYLLLWSEGGLYADVDVVCERSIDDWLPAEIRNQAGLILGMEYDDTLHPEMPNVTLAQYTMVSRPGHPVMHAVVEQVLDNLEAMGDCAPPPENNGTPRPGVISAVWAPQILEATGPNMFQRVVFDTLRKTSSFDSIIELHRIKQPKLYGDVVILPINGFGSGQEHSESGNPEMGDKFAQHLFRMSWMNHESWQLDFTWRDRELPGKTPLHDFGYQPS